MSPEILNGAGNTVNEVYRKTYAWYINGTVSGEEEMRLYFGLDPDYVQEACKLDHYSPMKTAQILAKT